MASFKQYTASGGASEAFSIPTFSSDEIKVYVNNVLKTAGTGTTAGSSHDYELQSYTVNGGTVAWVSGKVPANPAVVRIIRDTDILNNAGTDVEGKATYYAGSSIKAGDLNDNHKQALRALEEQDDQLIQKYDIEPDAIDGTLIKDDSIDSEHYVAGSIDLEHMSANSVDSDQYVDGSIDTIHIADDQVTYAKVQNVSATDRVLGRDSSGAGIIEEIAPAALRTMINVEDGSTADQTGAEIKSAYEGESNTNAYTDAEKTKLAGIAISANNYSISSDLLDEDNFASDSATKVPTQQSTKAYIAATSQPLDSDLTTLAGMQSGTASILASGTALTSTTAELNLLDGKSIVTTISSPTDAQIPTAQAVDERITSVVTDVGGFVPIADKDSFPETNPDPADNAGTIISIADAGGLIVDGSGVSINGDTITTNATVTINGIDSSLHSSTIAAGKGMLIETTSTLNTYTYHRLVVDEAGVANAQTLVSDFGDRYQVAGSTPSAHPDSSALQEGDLWFDTAANTMKVYDGSNYAAVTSVGDYKLLTILDTDGSAFDGANQSFNLKDGSNAAVVTSAGQLIVSVNGVIQKPNAGTGAPSEGFALVDSDTIIFSAAPGSGASVFVTLIGSATSVNVPATNSIVEGAIQTNVVSEEKLKVSNNPTNDLVLTADSGVSGGMKWAESGSVITWTLGINGGANAYTFTGDGFASATDDPDLWLSRGKTYKFVNGNSSGTHAFNIEKSDHDATWSAYTTGMTGAGATGGNTMTWTVPMDAPSLLKYVSGTTSGMTGFIYIADGNNSDEGFECWTGSRVSGLQIDNGPNGSHMAFFGTHPTGYQPTIIGSSGTTTTFQQSAGYDFDSGNINLQSYGTNTTTPATIKFEGGGSNNTYGPTISGPATAQATSNYTITLPGVVPTANGQALVATTAGVASWADVGVTSDAQDNTVAGTNAGDSFTGTDATYNTLIGHDAGTAITTGDSNTALGDIALDALTTGNYNTAIGRNSLGAITTVDNNTAVGVSALAANEAAANTAVGRAALEANTSGTQNTSVGAYCLDAVTTGASNTGIGYACLTNSTAAQNTAVGAQALYANTSGIHNDAFGYNALAAVTTTNNNTAFGYRALEAHTATSGVAFGARALYSNTSGNNNTAVGDHALSTNTTASENTAVGHLALEMNETGAYNTAVGANALEDSTIGGYNTAVGENAGHANTEGEHNTCIGARAGDAATTADNNTSVGSAALSSTTTGYDNVAVGHQALYANTTGVGNVAIGKDALDANDEGHYNIAIGREALSTSTDQSNNVAIGRQALKLNSSGNANVAIGHEALENNSTGTSNTALGYEALTGNTTGSNNVAIGTNALDAVVTGGQNIAIGVGALGTNTSGYNNVAIGHGANDTITSGYNSIAIGYDCKGVTDGQANTYLGSNLGGGNANNFAKIYQGNIIASYGPSDSDWSFSSDGRDKTDIVDLPLGLAFIEKIKPRKYRWNFRDTSRFPIDSKDNPDILIKSGFIAQELQAVLADEGVKYTGIVNENDPDNLTVADGALIPMLVNAVKELSTKVKALEAK